VEPLKRGRSTTDPRLECNGETATLEQIWALDLSPSGHFTAMQVRGRRTLGTDFHLTRLDAATRELFDVGLDGELVREYIRHALADDIEDASVRVNVFRPDAAADVSVMVGVRPPAPTPTDPQSLLPVDYLRPRAHIKHASGFGQGYFAGLAQANGFDEALFVGPDGRIAEGSITNIGFLSGDEIVWPEAPQLDGVMMQVLQRELDRAHISWRHEPVRMADVASLDGAFVTNSRGFASVARIGELELPAEPALSRTARELLAAAPYDPI
jgi:branched-subunit amino acid aminotransferase/4-amino-4-deoxychorismate lyase